MANTVSNMDELERRILELEKIQVQQIAELKMSATGVADSLTPSNLLKNALKDVVQTPGLGSAAINTAIGMGAGFLTKKILIGSSGNIFKKITGNAVEFLITNFVRNKIPAIKENNLPPIHKN